MINVGIAGIGFMGMIHYLAYQRVRGARVAAICTRDARKLAGDWRGIQGNFGPPGTKMDLGSIRRHRSIEELLADRDIDVIDICLPPSMHAEVAAAAFRAGKHVFCEKPVALTVADARRMLKAARGADRLLFVAHVLPFMPPFAYAQKVIAEGKHGRLLGAHFKRIISDPLWIKDFYNPRTVGGPVIDLHIHDAHFIRLIAGMPRAVFSRGRTRGEVVEFLETQFLYEQPEPVIAASSGVIRQQGRSFTHGFEIHLERASLVYDFAVTGGEAVEAVPLTVLSGDGKAVRPKLSSGDSIDGFVAEIKELVASIRANRPSRILGGDLAVDALELCQSQSQSVFQRRLVKVKQSRA